LKIRENFQLILKTYTENQAIAKNKFLARQKQTYSSSQPDLSNIYIVGYLVAKACERAFKSRLAALVDELLAEVPSLVNILGINQDQIRQQLDVLAKQKIIEKRSSRPYTVGSSTSRKEDMELNYQMIRLWNAPIDLLEQAYDNDAAIPNQPLIKSLVSVMDDNDNFPDFSQILEWASELWVIEGGSSAAVRMVS
jgi:hypothetical protein